MQQTAQLPNMEPIHLQMPRATVAVFIDALYNDEEARAMVIERFKPSTLHTTHDQQDQILFKLNKAVGVLEQQQAEFATALEEVARKYMDNNQTVLKVKNLLHDAMAIHQNSEVSTTAADINAIQETPEAATNTLNKIDDATIRAVNGEAVDNAIGTIPESATNTQEKIDVDTIRAVNEEVGDNTSSHTLTCTQTIEESNDQLSIFEETVGKRAIHDFMDQFITTDEVFKDLNERTKDSINSVGNRHSTSPNDTQEPKDESPKTSGKTTPVTSYHTAEEKRDGKSAEPMSECKPVIHETYKVPCDPKHGFNIGTTEKPIWMPVAVGEQSEAGIRKRETKIRCARKNEQVLFNQTFQRDYARAKDNSYNCQVASGNVELSKLDDYEPAPFGPKEEDPRNPEGDKAREAEIDAEDWANAKVPDLPPRYCEPTVYRGEERDVADFDFMRDQITDHCISGKVKICLNEPINVKNERGVPKKIALVEELYWKQVKNMTPEEARCAVGAQTRNRLDKNLRVWMTRDDEFYHVNRYTANGYDGWCKCDDMPLPSNAIKGPESELFNVLEGEDDYKKLMRVTKPVTWQFKSYRGIIDTDKIVFDHFKDETSFHDSKEGREAEKVLQAYELEPCAPLNPELFQVSFPEQTRVAAEKARSYEEALAALDEMRATVEFKPAARQCPPELEHVARGTYAPQRFKGLIPSQVIKAAARPAPIANALPSAPQAPYPVQGLGYQGIPVAHADIQGVNGRKFPAVHALPQCGFNFAGGAYEAGVDFSQGHGYYDARAVNPLLGDQSLQATFNQQHGTYQAQPFQTQNTFQQTVYQGQVRPPPGLVRPGAQLDPKPDIHQVEPAPAFCPKPVRKGPILAKMTGFRAKSKFAILRAKDEA